jgi:oleate hydratase
MLEFSRIETLAGIKRTVLNQYDSLVVPLQHWLASQGVRLVTDCTVTDLAHKTEDGLFEVIALNCRMKEQEEILQLEDGDLVFVQNGSMTDASSLGSMTAAPAKLKKPRNSSWTLWERLPEGRPSFGNPAAFNSCIAQSDWASFTVTLKAPAFFEQMQRFSGNEAGTGGLVTFKDSNWLMSIVLAHQPHFANEPADVQVFWGYGHFS